MDSARHDVVNELFRARWARPVVAGLVGTVVFDLIGFLMTGQWWDIPALLGDKLGFGIGGGVVAHYANGVILALIYTGLAPLLWGPAWLRALTYVTAETVFGVWLFMLPLLGLGIAGLAASPLLPVITLARHWGYGLILAWLVGDPRPAFGSQPTGQSLRPGVRTVSGLVMVVGVMSLLASTPAGLEASDRGQAPVGSVTPSAEVTPARNPTLHKTIKVAGLEIFYREAGPRGAPTILLLHGFPTSSHMFRALILALSDRYHVVAPDYPGFGHSSMPPVDQFEYTFDRLADVMDQFVQQLGLTKYSLYVMDYGAPVGFRLAVKHPERVQALIVQNGNAYEEGLRDFWTPFRAYWGARTEATAAPLRKFLVLEATKWQYTHGVRNPEAISPDNWLVDQSLLDRPGNREIQLQLFFDYGSNLALYPSWQSYFRAHQPPTLVVWGKNDYIFPAEGALPYARDLKTLETHLLDTGHFALEEDGALIAHHMRRFLIKHVRSTNK